MNIIIFNLKIPEGNASAIYFKSSFKKKMIFCPKFAILENVFGEHMLKKKISRKLSFILLFKCSSSNNCG